MPSQEILIEVWRRARKAAMESPNGAVLFLDEIRLIPQWSNTVKWLWDQMSERTVHFV